MRMSPEAKERARAYCREYYYKHKEHRLMMAKKWAREHPDIHYERVRSHARKRIGLFIGGETKSGICPLCKKEKQLVPDHDYKTGQLRDWICEVCNLQLGQFEKREADGRHQLYREYLARFI